MALALKFVARSDVGLIREGNEDSGYAGPWLLAVADGMGGHAAGEVASSVALSTLASLEDDVPATEVLGALAAAVASANEAISDLVEKHPQLDGMGTTLTALLWSGRRMGVVHIGDSRAYLLREGVLTQITHDHTFVQQLQDEGRITADEAAIHPQRSLLLRCLDGRNTPEPDLSVREMQLGDRVLVCSDGLSGVVSDAGMAAAMTGTDLGTAADTLVQLALQAGGPDNITCVVADVVEVAAALDDDPQVVGAAAGKHRRTQESSSTSEIDLSGLPELLAATPAARTRKGRVGTWWMRLLIAGVAAAVVGIGWAAYSWSQDRYYVGAQDGQVAIFKGLHQNVLGKSLSRSYERSDIQVAELPTLDQERVDDTIFAEDVEEAREVLDRLRAAAAGCRAERIAVEAAASAVPTATPTPKPSARIAGVATGRPTATETPSATATPTPTPEPAPTPASDNSGCTTAPPAPVAP
ncbi:MAG: PP2C family protein-serine/threonine phosphatase [Sporichthyaceae bacterium]